MMIRCFLILCCFSLLHSDKDVISWNETYKLSWSDFEAAPKVGIDAVALTASGITFNYSSTQSEEKGNTYNTNVEAHFYPEKSWYKPNKATAYILSHEQLHFDIAELYARKFRQRISNNTFTKDIASELNKLYGIIDKELEQTQNKYDSETEHSINTTMQEKWSNYVKTELKKLSKYKSAN